MVGNAVWALLLLKQSGTALLRRRQGFDSGPGTLPALPGFSLPTLLPATLSTVLSQIKAQNAPKYILFKKVVKRQFDVSTGSSTVCYA